MKEEKTKLYQKWWFWLCIVLILCIIATVVILIMNKDTNKVANTGTIYYDTSDFDTTYFDTYNSNQTNEAKLKENIKIEYAGITKSGDFIIKVTNNNSVPVHISEITTIYKDGNGTFMKKETSNDKYFGIEANSETYVHNWGYQENFAQYAKYEFDFNFSGDWVSGNSIIGNYEIKANNTGKNIALEIKNNNYVSIEDIKVGVVFYEAGQIVGYENGYDYDNTTNSGMSAYINVEYPKNKNYDKVKFDNYKVYILNADATN